ncbi:MAG: S9 family peptidase [Bacteroidales bacterium]|nr:MAG: S9 family peptidase [Bacteroidales bacterium]
MKTRFIITLLIVTIMTLLSCTDQFQRAPEIPLEDFFKNPEKAYFKISPDGKYLSFTAPYENRMNIHIQEMGSDSVIQLTKETDRDIAGYLWANEARILYLKDDGGNENFKLYGVDIDGSNLKCLTDFKDVRTTIIDDLEDIPDYMIIGLNKRDPTVFDPYRININTGNLEILAENPGNIVGWMTDHDGKLRLAIAITGGINQTILYRETEQDDFMPVLTTSYKDNFEPHFFTFDNKNIYVSSNIGRDKMIIVEYDPGTGQEVDTLLSHDEVDVTRLHYSRKRKVLTSAGYYTTKQQRHFFDEQTEKMYDKLNEELGMYEIGIAGNDKEEQKFIVRTYSDRSRGAYYYFDYENSILDKIHDISPWLKEEHLAEMVPVEYKSRDGLTIHGYLTLPTGIKPKNLPVVIHPHGGPWARDRWGFNPEVQFLANQGYAVLQMNFRGSTGYGKEFWLKSMKQWGQTMQDDITDGVKWIIQQGIADRDKIAIYGGSYGGYATLAGLAFTPDVYACGVDYVGVSNMFTFMKTIPPYWEPIREMFYEMVGDPEKDSIMMAEVSPVMHADKIIAPLFVAQGANDPRVNKAESDQMVEAIRARGIDVEYMVKDNEGHGFRNEENRFDFYCAMGKFLARHIGDSIQ